ncbi:NUDIX hydrolase [Phenylobacterium sp.]|uniref:NUDIX hydrolase n=1 Tax=Phenylobacterium sp. TaxID=1871053 RepID=UPI0027332884|nr:NUDIX domain-containing protein [Phenylobacterium sp.]MDP3660470.1 NUDIX domain-containing protein [Phenylobacterium sp.]
MRERRTARVLLLDPHGRILLMKGRLPSRPDAPGAWFTVGGGADPDETLEQAALREVFEETGFSDVVLGPAVWLRESVLALEGGEAVLFCETYFVAHCAGAEPNREGWDEVERRLVDDIRWWRLVDLLACGEPVYPEAFAYLAPDIVAGRLPREPLVITAPRALDGV